MTESKTAIIFDMDGVLVDSEAYYYERRKAFLAEFDLTIEGLTLPELVGADMRSLWQKIEQVNKKELDIAFLNEQYIAYKKEHPIDYLAVLDENAKRVLQFLKRQGYKIGLASSSTKDAIEEVLTVGQLSSYFDAVVSGEDFEESKPAPDIYLHTLQELAVAPQECIAIEDSEKGIASAKEAGLEVWAMRDEHFGMDQSQADAFLTQLSDICKKISENRIDESSESTPS